MDFESVTVFNSLLRISSLFVILFVLTSDLTVLLLLLLLFKLIISYLLPSLIGQTQISL